MATAPGSSWPGGPDSTHPSPKTAHSLFGQLLQGQRNDHSNRVLPPIHRADIKWGALPGVHSGHKPRSSPAVTICRAGQRERRCWDQQAPGQPGGPGEGAGSGSLSTCLALPRPGLVILDSPLKPQVWWSLCT